jgi:hypothetical protein
LFDRRHQQLVVFGNNQPLVQRAFIRFRCDNGRLAAAFECGLAGGKVEAAFSLFAAMAGNAIRFQDRLDVLREIDRGTSLRGKRDDKCAANQRNERRAKGACKHGTKAWRDALWRVSSVDIAAARCQPKDMY